ncbi:hypothetical protein [Sphingobium aromaticiconvertens]|uniref:hypothetical protein n=1 Tax=Sphingobium aromaticiconvertens TaxID=365341 RepID=UPI003018B1B8
MAITMRKLLPIFACLMLVLIAWSGTAYAAELGNCCATTQIEASSHSEGAQVPADDDKGYPHHHAGCHGHHVGTAATEKIISQPLPGAAPFGAGRSYALAAHHSGPALRPPQA